MEQTDGVAALSEALKLSAQSAMNA